MISTPLSALEVLAIDTGNEQVDMLPGVVAVAQSLERTGYRRVWYAEHHSSPSLIDFPPALMVAHVASRTSDIRVGSGGVLAANHSPLSLSEYFGALASCYPGRIDLGVGRGPGTLDSMAAQALRRGADPATDDEYREDVVAILGFSAERMAVPEPWLLASSSAGAALASELGLPLVFAYHIKPENALDAVERYRQNFRPSRWCETPRIMISVQTICAETEHAAAELALPIEINRAALRTRRADQPLLDRYSAAAYQFTPAEEEVVNTIRSQQVQGTPETVCVRLKQIADKFEADELMLFTPISDWKERVRSFELVGMFPS